MKFEFVPWTNYADRFLNELNSHGSLCDLSSATRSGSAAPRRRPVRQLNDFFKKEESAWTTTCRRRWSVIRVAEELAQLLGAARYG